MKTIVWMGAVSMAAMALAGCNPSANTSEDKAGAAGTAAALDAPKPGLWRVSTAMDVQGAPELPPQEICITESKLEAPSSTSQQGAECTSTPYKREGDAMISTASCKLPGNMTSESTVRVTGDFNSRYVTEVVTTMDPAPTPQLAQTKVTLTAERLGDCPAS